MLFRSRPLKIPAARRYQLSNGIETPLIVTSRLDYGAMPNKASTGTVTQFFFDPQMTLAQFNVWPTPSDNTSAVKFTAQRPLQDLNIISNTFDFPQEWGAALAWGWVFFERATFVIGEEYTRFPSAQDHSARTAHEYAF